MAEIITSSKNGKRKTATPRIDLTPMVDLGFLLITFFMFTTTMAKSRVMAINMPSTEPTTETTAFPEESTITIILEGAHRIAYYDGSLKDPPLIKYAAIADERDILLAMQNLAKSLPASLSANAHKLHVLIKPDDKCSYNDVVATLDEMNILAIDNYAMVDITAEEKQYLKK